jgi:hypothetical protein
VLLPFKWLVALVSAIASLFGGSGSTQKPAPAAAPPTHTAATLFLPPTSPSGRTCEHVVLTCRSGPLDHEMWVCTLPEVSNAATAAAARSLAREISDSRLPRIN